MKEQSSWALWIFNATYLFWGGAFFLQDFNLEFVIYVAVIIIIMGSVLLTVSYTDFPHWLLWLLSLWGLLHVLGGAVQIDGGVLFGYHLYPFLDLGGDFYILKYDQVVHLYLYGVVAMMAYHLLRNILTIKGHTTLLFLIAVMASVGVSALNEIMEFSIAVTVEQNGVGGYENAMLDLIFNLSGAVIATGLMVLCSGKRGKVTKEDTVPAKPKSRKK
jgi:putative membrane protein